MLHIHVLVYAKSTRTHRKIGANTETIKAVESMNTLCAFIAAMKISERTIAENARNVARLLLSKILSMLGRIPLRQQRSRR